MVGTFTGIISLAGDASTVLSLLRTGGRWRVQITWPNGHKSYFGNFHSEEEASNWIAAHDWLTRQTIDADENLKRKPIHRNR